MITTLSYPKLDRCAGREALFPASKQQKGKISSYAPKNGRDRGKGRRSENEWIQNENCKSQ